MNIYQRALTLIVLLIALQVLFKSPSVSQAQDIDTQVAELMAQMSVNDKVGQLFMVPFLGDNANPDSDIWQLITEYRVGGVILQSANSNFRNDPSAPQQITALVNVLQTTAFRTNGVPLFVSLDHEGDDYPYTRITESLTSIPSPMALGATWNTDNAEAIGAIIGEEMNAMGVNMILGPSLDVLNDPRPTGRGDIGIRVFGGDPYWVSQMGRAYIRGIHVGSEGKVMTVAKHFPGHGGSDRLPDNEVATVDKSLQELQRIELPPFFYVTAQIEDDPQGVTEALMSSHIRYRGFQGDIRQFTAPISFDAEGMQTLLELPEIAQWRDQGGLIVSDALGVPAVRKHYDPTLQTFPHRRIAKEAFLAGNDVLSVAQYDLNSIWSAQFANIKDTIFFFRTEYNNNPTFASQVDAAVARILRTKLKLYPNPTLDALNREAVIAQEIANQTRPVVHQIAQEGLTLLYPSPEELRLRIPAPPRSDEKMLIVTDTRLARQCFAPDCGPEELFLTRVEIQDTILRLYGPEATGQIQPEQINTITFSELKAALGTSITGPDGPPPNENEALRSLVQVPVDIVQQQIQEADWLVFATLDLNISRYEDSDALKIFLTQQSGTLLNKTTVVFAFNAPYYLDTTEVTKLTAYYGVYSKTTPHLEAAVRALFGEVGLPGASPVSVEGIGYQLADVLSPNLEQNLFINIKDIAPENRLAPVSVTVEVGPIFDHNNRLVPDGTPVELKVDLAGREIISQVEHTVSGMIEETLILEEIGAAEVYAVAGPALISDRVIVAIENPATPTTTATVSPTNTPSPTETPTTPPTNTPSPQPTATSTPTPVILAEAPTSPPTAQTALPSRVLDGLDLLSAMSATLLAGLLGFWLGHHTPKPLSRQVRMGLLVIIGGLIAYLLYGLGWLRPEQWFINEPDLIAGRLSIAVLAFIFGLIAIGIGNGGVLSRR